MNNFNTAQKWLYDKIINNTQIMELIADASTDDLLNALEGL
jgi:hypothetical protein